MALHQKKILGIVPQAADALDLPQTANLGLQDGVKKLGDSPIPARPQQKQALPVDTCHGGVQLLAKAVIGVPVSKGAPAMISPEQALVC